METYSEKLDKRRAYCREWRKNNQKKIKEYRNKYKEENKEKKNAVGKNFIKGPL